MILKQSIKSKESPDMYKEKRYLDSGIKNYNELLLFKLWNRKNFVPNFIGVGAGRCGTTSVYRYLDKHQQVYMSPVKEINYFGYRSKERNPNGMTFSEYQTFFVGADKGQIIGEISPIYLNQPYAVEEIKKYLPESKILIFIRNPLDRAISQYFHHKSKHKYKDINDYFECALKALEQTERLHRNWYHPAKNLLQSFYAKGISSYIAAFGTESVHIIKFDELSRNSEQVLKSLCKFLKIQYVDQLLSKTNVSVRQEQEKNMSCKVHEMLMDVFHQDILETEKITGLDLSDWVNECH